MKNAPKEACHYRTEHGRHICGLCPHGCRISAGSRGICGSRLGDEHILLADNYGKVATVNIDPLEKKPLYHFRPGEEVLSVGGWGCNMGCLHCQNNSLSMARGGGPSGRRVEAEELVAICHREGLRNLAFTYNEPTIWHEYVMDVAELADGIDLIYVTNGYINPSPRSEVLERITAMNLDVKGFSESFYREVAKADLGPVLDTAEDALESGVHLEITYLLIPGRNDDHDQLQAFCRWLSSLSPDVPVHFSAFHRDHLMQDVRDTNAEDLLRAFSLAKDSGLRFVYLGNLPVSQGRDTVCPRCGDVAVSRKGYRTDTSGMRRGACASCATALNMRL